jgi:hypothetical protein
MSTRDSSPSNELGHREEDSMAENVANGLDWQRFSAKHFPGRGRHDFEALTAYGAYKRSRKAGESPAEEADPAPKAESAAEGSALDDWEDEGGR